MTSINLDRLLALALARSLSRSLSLSLALSLSTGHVTGSHCVDITVVLRASKIEMASLLDPKQRQNIHIQHSLLSLSLSLSLCHIYIYQSVCQTHYVSELHKIVKLVTMAVHKFFLNDAKIEMLIV